MRTFGTNLVLEAKRRCLTAAAVPRESGETANRVVKK